MDSLEEGNIQYAEMSDIPQADRHARAKCTTPLLTEYQHGTDARAVTT